MTGTAAVACKCAIERMIESRLPKHYLNARMSDFSAEIRELVTASRTEPAFSLLLTGPVGSGKTHLAAAICRHLIENGRNARFAICERYYSDLRESYRAGNSEEAVIAPLERVTFLVLDDLGAGSLSDHERRSTLTLLSRRLNAKLTTIVTTNWSLPKIAERMDDRIASRLAAFRAIELVGSDRRLNRVGGDGPEHR
jgi:DNA replication protein DnaC